MNTYLIAGLCWAVGMYVGLYISAHRNPLTVKAVLENDRKRRIMAEAEFRHLVEVRTGKVDPIGSYEKYIVECSERKFARRCEQMFQSYDQDLRGSEVFVKIMAGALPFEVKNTLSGSTDFEQVEYY